MNNMEIYDIQLSLDEGIVRDMFPKIARFLHKIVNKKEMMAALDEYVKRVSRGDAATQSLLATVSKIYKGVDEREMESLIDTLIKAGKLDKRFDPL